MTESEEMAHLRRIIEFERKQYEEQRQRYLTHVDHLEKLAYQLGAKRLLEGLEGANWERKLTKAQARGAEHILKILRGLADMELTEPDKLE